MPPLPHVIGAKALPYSVELQLVPPLPPQPAWPPPPQPWEDLPGPWLAGQPPPFADSVPLIYTDPGEVAVMFSEPTTLTVVPRAVLNREETRKEDWPLRKSVQALRKVNEEPRHTRFVEAV